MTKVSFGQSTTLPRTDFGAALTSYMFSNDSASAITVFLDDAQFVVEAGEVVKNSAGERLRSLRVATNGLAWRFLGEY